MSIMRGRPRKEIFEEIASIKKFEQIAFAEKDWYVTQVIGIISKIKIDGFSIIFSGGTALAKAHKLINRFSEDIDFRVVAAESVNTRSKRSKFKQAVIEQLCLAGCVIKNEHIKARDENHFFAVELEYETYFARSTYLRPHIQIEVIIRDIQLPPEKHSVSSFFAELSKEPPEVPEILCTQPAENAADKLSALAWRIPDRIRGSYNDDLSIVRHIHDLALLKDKALQCADFKKIVQYSMQCDNFRSKNNVLFQTKSMQDKLTEMFNILEQDAKYPKEYDSFVKMMSYASYKNRIPNFKVALQCVKLLANKVVL